MRRLLFRDGHLDGYARPVRAAGFWGVFRVPEERPGARPFFIRRTSSPPPGVTPFLLFFTVGFSVSVIHRARPYNTFNFKLGALFFFRRCSFCIFFFILAPSPPVASHYEISPPSFRNFHIIFSAFPSRVSHR